MKIYLVRHGQTGGNVAMRHQTEHTSLTDLGHEQARQVAEIIRLYQPTHLLTSKYVRAIETSRIIGEVCNLIPETSANFVELLRPQNMYGHHHKSARSVWFYFWWYLGFFGGATEAEGESYRTLRERFKKAQAELATYPNDARVVVVSHAAFIGLFTAHLCQSRALNPFQATRAFYRILTMPNTYITTIYLDLASSKSKCIWRVER
jgi:broad specificity phosphatase PhoE